MWMQLKIIFSCETLIINYYTSTQYPHLNNIFSNHYEKLRTYYQRSYNYIKFNENKCMGNYSYYNNYY